MPGQLKRSSGHTLTLRFGRAFLCSADKLKLDLLVLLTHEVDVSQVAIWPMLTF